MYLDQPPKRVILFDVVADPAQRQQPGRSKRLNDRAVVGVRDTYVYMYRCIYI